MESVVNAIRNLLSLLMQLPGFRGSVIFEINVDADAKSCKVVHRVDTRSLTE
jgi:hypothetical protein